MTARTKAGAKAKGTRFERQIERECRLAFPNADVWTSRQRTSGHGLPDVAVDKWLHLECKNQDTVSWMGALKQATRDAGQATDAVRVPIAIIKDARFKRGRVIPIAALMSWESWDELRAAYRVEFGRVLNAPWATHIDTRKRPCWSPATDAHPGLVCAMNTDPPACAMGWEWLRDEVLAPLWRVGNAGGKGA